MAASPYMRITLYQQRQKITSLNTIEFLDTYVFINSPHWQSSGILIFLCKYYVVISDALVNSFLGAVFLLLAVILSELYDKARRKDWVKGYHFFDCTFSCLCLFVAFFVYPLLVPNRRACGMTPIKIHILSWMVFCLMMS